MLRTSKARRLAYKMRINWRTKLTLEHCVKRKLRNDAVRRRRHRVVKEDGQKLNWCGLAIHNSLHEQWFANKKNPSKSLLFCLEVENFENLRLDGRRPGLIPELIAHNNMVISRGKTYEFDVWRHRVLKKEFIIDSLNTEHLTTSGEFSNGKSSVMSSWKVLIYCCWVDMRAWIWKSKVGLICYFRNKAPKICRSDRKIGSENPEKMPEWNQVWVIPRSRHQLTLGTNRNSLVTKI